MVCQLYIVVVQSRYSVYWVLPTNYLSIYYFYSLSYLYVTKIVYLKFNNCNKCNILFAKLKTLIKCEPIDSQ